MAATHRPPVPILGITTRDAKNPSSTGTTSAATISASRANT
jgi:hypothetical protein